MKKDVTYVIGHKNPDTDSICSALALAEFKKLEGGKNIEAARAGDVNPQTSYLLERFNVSPPRFLSNVYPRAKDIMTVDVLSVEESTPIIKVMEIIRDRNVRFIPVLNSEKKAIGILAPVDIARNNIAQFETEKSRHVYTSLKNIVTTLGARTVSDKSGNDEKTYSVYVGAMEEESFLNVLGKTNPEECIVIVGDREGIQRISVERKIGILIVTGNLKVSDEIARAAEKNGVSIIISPFDSATTALLVRMSTPAYKVCNDDFETASGDDLAEELKQRLSTNGGRGIVVVDKEGAMAGVITKSNLLKPSGIKLILVDHNELSQAVDGADMVKISEVVDHHRLGNFHTTHPIRFICEPVGSTSTLVSEMYKKSGISISEQIASLLLGGVMSDTVILKSPTTTDRDRDIVPWLEEKSGLNHAEFGKEMFSATSSLKKIGPTKAVNSDYKTFEARGNSFGVGQVETIGFDEFFEEKEKLSKELILLKEAKGLKLSALLVTDIVLGTSLLLVEAEKEVIYNIGYPQLEEKVYELKNVLSRKKQVAPHLLSLFNEIY